MCTRNRRIRKAEKIALKHRRTLPPPKHVVYPEDDKLHNEVLLLFGHFSNEMNTAKENQWKTLYYSLVLDFAVIAAFALELDLSKPLLDVVGGTAMVVVGLCGLFQIAYQRAHVSTIHKNRLLLWQIEGYMTRPWSNTLMLQAGLGPYSPGKRKLRDRLLYAGLFSVLSFAGAVTAIIVILYELDFI